jgi:hypothetical protein
MNAALRLALVAAVALTAGCGGSDASSSASMLCKAEIAVLCNRTFTCPGLAEMQTMWTSEDDCNAQSAPSCDGPTTCVSGTYHADKDQQCLDAMNAVTCADLAADPGALLPAVCLEVCTAS